METVTIPKTTAICAARYFVAAHESECLGRPVNFSGPCIRCSENQRCLTGKLIDWPVVIRPLFDAVGGIPFQLARAKSGAREDNYAEEAADFVRGPLDNERNLKELPPQSPDMTESEKAEIAYQALRGGVPTNEVRKWLGQEPLPDEWANERTIPL